MAGSRAGGSLAFAAIGTLSGLGLVRAWSDEMGTDPGCVEIRRSAPFLSVAIVMGGLVLFGSAGATQEQPTRVRNGEPPSTIWSWTGALYFLGGVETSLGSASASVDSGVTRESGEEEEIASGDVSQWSWGLSLYSGPLESGFYFRPTGGYLSQEISIRDFEDDIPITTEAEARYIGARCSDADTGETVDCRAPNVYDLTVQSFYGGAQGGYDHVWAWRWLRYFLGVGASVNLAEYRLLDVSFAGTRLEAQDFAFLRSWGAQATAGLAFPDVGIVVRVIGLAQWHIGFEYDEPIEFMGPVDYDNTQNIYYRPRMFVRDASLQLLDARLAVAYLF